MNSSRRTLRDPADWRAARGLVLPHTPRPPHGPTLPSHEQHGDSCVAWCQYGRTDEISRIKNPGKYVEHLDRLPDWRIGCIFTGSRHRGRGVATAAVRATLESIAQEGGGLVEAYPEQQEGRAPQRGAYFQTGTESLYAGFGFARHRRIAKWRWVMRLEVASVSDGRPG